MKALVTLAASLLLASSLPSCSDRDSTVATSIGKVSPLSSIPPTTSDQRVVLITIDGARWQDVFGGSDSVLSGAAHVPAEELMPRTYGLLAERGVALGADREGCSMVRTASGANMSLPGYQEIFTGLPSSCLDNECDGVSTSVMDEAAVAKVAGVASIGAWSMLDRAVSGGGAGVFVAAGHAWPADGPTGASMRSPILDSLVTMGENADAFPGHNDYRPDTQTAGIALEYLRAARPAFLHIGLGDTDEFGHRDDYPAYLVALRNADTVIGAVADTLDAMGELGRKTTIIVTPDHGRNSDFKDHGVLRSESGRTFLFVFGERVKARGIGCPSHEITLADITPTIRVLLGLPARQPTKHAGTAITGIW